MPFHYRTNILLNFVLTFLLFQIQHESCSAKSPPEPFNNNCLVGQKSLYPPPSTTSSVPKFVVNLDQPPFIRWREIGEKYKKDINDLATAIKSVLTPIFGPRFITFLEWSLGDLDSRFPPPYADELRGLANATGVPLGEVVLFNIFYEIFTVCTSIIAQDETNSIYHARNMDFGILLGWNKTSHDWLITEKLRRIVINVDFNKNGTLLYRAATFAGYIGIYNAMRPNAYAVTVNERFKLDGGYRGIFEWFFKKNQAQWMSWMVRDVFETTTEYDTAVRKLSTMPVIAPLYVIISGTRSGQGKLIVRSRNGTDGTVDLDTSKEDGWFILQTNTDPWSQPIFFDDRRTPGRACMNRMTRRNTSLANLFQVLSSPTTINKLTVFSLLIKTDQDKFENYIQKCPDPCWPW